MTTRDATTSLGLIRGVDADGLLRFTGIPYAQPPVGPLRFAAPEPVKPWPGFSTPPENPWWRPKALRARHRSLTPVTKGKTMTADANILHHVGLITRDMDATIAQYERLGFSFTPLTLPRIPMRPGGAPELLGAGNRTAVFTDNYLEVLAVVDEARWTSVTPEQRGPFDLDRPLARYEGLHVMHFGTDDIDALHDRLSDQGVRNGGIHPYQRTVDTDDGPRPMRARALGFPPEANPEALVQIAQHLTPELVFQERYQHHDNGATGIVEITVCAVDPEDLAGTYSRYTGHAHTRDGDEWTVDLGRSCVRVVSPDALPDVIPGAKPPAVPSLIGFTVTVGDLDATQALLADRAVPLDVLGDTVLVPATHAAGAAVSFVAADAHQRS